jgi:gluconolactonase
MKHLTYIFVAMTFLSCNPKEKAADNNADTTARTFGTVEGMDPAFDALVKSDAKIEIIAEGFEWSEGPLWIEEKKMLLFSDVPTNIVYKWTEENGKQTYLTPSGRTGSLPYGNEPGSNGLTLNPEGKLVLCQHGDRRVALMDAPLTAPAAKFISVADNFDGKKFNSPNDAVFNSKGDLFLTDPPYGLPEKEKDPTREISFHGVYKVTGGVPKLITDSITRPNGIALFPGDKRLLVANSDPAKPIWYSFDIADDGTASNAAIFYDATEAAKTEKGLPDGLKIDKNGNVFASGPGGIWIFDQNGKLLGRIKIPELVSNCAFSSDEKTLFVTADMYLVRVKLRD